MTCFTWPLMRYRRPYQKHLKIILILALPNLDLIFSHLILATYNLRSN